ncbi:hypothetical protein HHX47_DHR1001167 [Lentinula edodes]|nr:hypothetical protein HHX47_DHR1001167 [Lentinula edodes]
MASLLIELPRSLLKVSPKGCVETDRHTNDVPDPESKAPAAFAAEKEIAKAPSKVLEVSAASSDPAPPPATAKVVPATLPVVTEEEDDLSAMAKELVVNITQRPLSFEKEVRVLEFEEFLKIEGCQTGRHLFSPKVNTDKIEEFTTCRLDHYQTLDQVHVSVFAKQVDKDRSNVKIDEQSVEVHLKKQDTRSWTILEKPTHDLGNIALTFGVTGRTGTIGAKESVLDAQNSARV